jgi:glycosyltransferase involved in cell wall biosynthesis
MSATAIHEGPTPFWSVMIPTYQPDAAQLRQAIESVLQQDPGAEHMQIEVLDDGSPTVDVAALVKEIAGERIVFSKNPEKLGLAGGFNRCIERARGQWVHILHQDDYLLPGFYEHLSAAAQRHPEVSLLATRSFFVDEQGVITNVSERLKSMEQGSHRVDDFFYHTPIQCPAVVVKKQFYKTHGGFLPKFTFTLDVEMWTRVISMEGGLVTPEILTCYRISSQSETGRLAQTGENLRDLIRLNDFFAARYPSFNSEKALRQVCDLAVKQAEIFKRNGNDQAAKANLYFWITNAKFHWRLRRFLRGLLNF